MMKIASWFMLVMPIAAIFYKENGLSIKEMFVLQSIFSISIVVLEVPSGYIADVFGYKKTLIAGAVLGFLGYSIYSISYGFVGFMIAEIVLGIGNSLISGADSALLYDSLLDCNKQNEYLKYEGRMLSAGNFSESVAGIFGGLLAALSIRYPYYFQASVAFFAIPAAITLIEPCSSKNRIEASWSQIFRIIRYSFIDEPRLCWNIILSSLIGTATLSMAWFVQPWLLRANVDLKLFGIVWTILNLLVGVSAMFAYRVKRSVGRRRLIVIFTLLLVLGYVLTGCIFNLWGLSFLVLFYIARGLAEPVLKDDVNQIASSETRATVLSVRNFSCRIMFAIWGPFVGWIADKWCLTDALVISGCILFVVGLYSVFGLFMVENRTK